MSFSELSPDSPPLAGLKVLDLSRVLAGPWCTMQLADLGADVLKVEKPGSGDDTRGWGPPFVGELSAYFLCANRNKHSVEVDFRTEEGAARIREWVRDADILVENYRAGTLERYGLDYDTLSGINPQLIYCSISGYGRNSPKADRAGYDFMIQAESGLMSVTGEVDGEPVRVGVAVADLFSGMYATQSILAALHARHRDGKGQHIDIALFDSQLAMLANVGADYLATGKTPRRFGNQHPMIVPYQVFETADGNMVVAVGNDKQYKTLCKQVLGRNDLYEDARFSENRSRVTHRDELIPLIATIFKTRKTNDWAELLDQHQIPFGHVATIAEAFESEEAVARQMTSRVSHPVVGDIRLAGSPMKFSRTKIQEPSPPPLLGEHNEDY